jgi:hypothetical protein
MWSVLKFFFIWFWLSLAVLLGSIALAAYTVSPVVGDPRTGLVVSAGGAGVLLGSALAVFMSIPAYFIARPKRHSSDDQYWSG